MITKQEKQSLILNIKDKDKKIKIASIIDKCNRSEALEKVTATSFLDLNEKKIITSILNGKNIRYEAYFPNNYCEKCILFFLPNYVDMTPYKEYISCIKISCKDISKLKHKDFMGSVYSMGVKNEFIGDIFLSEKYAYVFVLKEIQRYILDNLFKVGNQEVKCQDIEIDSEEVKLLKVEYIPKEYIIPSRRIDALLSEVYNLSRKEAKDKIVAGDLCINACECINPSETFFKDDIISFRRCGKLKVGEELRITRNGNICIKIYKYK